MFAVMSAVLAVASRSISGLVVPAKPITPISPRVAPAISKWPSAANSPHIASRFPATRASWSALMILSASNLSVIERLQ